LRAQAGVGILDLLNRQAGLLGQPFQLNSFLFRACPDKPRDTARSAWRRAEPLDIRIVHGRSPGLTRLATMVNLLAGDNKTASRCFYYKKASAADLKFLQRLPQARLGTSNRKRH
jgi:hypothetical protein